MDINKKLSSLAEDTSISLPWLEKRTILLVQTGSYAYGTNTPESDIDYKGVCIPPKEYFLGLNSFNEYNNSGGKNFKNTKDDVDITIMHINKFVKDAMQGVPNNIEMLFVRKEDILKVNSFGQVLLDNRHIFLSKLLKGKFYGYAKSQAMQLQKKLENGTGRTDLTEHFGFDTKFFMHAVRLLTSGIEILTTGNFSTYRTNRDFLLDCRYGRFTLQEALELLAYLDDELNNAARTSSLPEKPDYDRVNKLLMTLNESALSSLNY